MRLGEGRVDSKFIRGLLSQGKLRLDFIPPAHLLIPLPLHNGVLIALSAKWSHLPVVRLTSALLRGVCVGGWC
jgi:hypothetical protein